MMLLRPIDVCLDFAAGITRAISVHSELTWAYRQHRDHINSGEFHIDLWLAESHVKQFIGRIWISCNRETLSNKAKIEVQVRSRERWIEISKRKLTIELIETLVGEALEDLEKKGYFPLAKVGEIYQQMDASPNQFAFLDVRFRQWDEKIQLKRPYFSDQESSYFQGIREISKLVGTDVDGLLMFIDRMEQLGVKLPPPRRV
ncbi:MAG: hypothetical protein ACFFB3_01350 [Candidatus Hodarchaeota archaeon]